MRVRTLSKLVLLGLGGGAAAFAYARRLGAPPPDDDAAEDDREPTVIPDSLNADPADPVQGIDEVHEFHIEDLGVDAMSEDDVDSELATAETESSLDQASLELDTPAQTTLDAIEQAAHDVGDLYGSHTPPAVDRDHRDDRAAMDEGQNWLEALETSAAENGADPDHGLDGIVDDEDVNAAPHPTDTRDIPVADRGAGGPAGI